MGGTHHAAKYVAKRTSHRDGGKKPGQHLPPALDRIHVRNDRGGGRSIGRLSRTNEDAGEQEDPKSRRKARTRRGETPDGHAKSDDDPTRHAIRQKPENRGQDHVTEQKRRREAAGFGQGVRVVGKKGLANLGLHRREDVAVDVAEEIEAQQEEQSAASAE